MLTRQMTSKMNVCYQNLVLNGRENFLNFFNDVIVFVTHQDQARGLLPDSQQNCDWKRTTRQDSVGRENKFRLSPEGERPPSPPQKNESKRNYSKVTLSLNLQWLEKKCLERVEHFCEEKKTSLKWQIMTYLCENGKKRCSWKF